MKFMKCVIIVERYTIDIHIYIGKCFVFCNWFIVYFFFVLLSLLLMPHRFDLLTPASLLGLVDKQRKEKRSEIKEMERWLRPSIYFQVLYPSIFQEVEFSMLLI